MLEPDEVITLASGTEISMEAALGDLDRAIDFLSNGRVNGIAVGLMSDLETIKGFILWLATRVEG